VREFQRVPASQVEVGDTYVDTWRTFTVEEVEQLDGYVQLKLNSPSQTTPYLWRFASEGPLSIMGKPRGEREARESAISLDDFLGEGVDNPRTEDARIAVEGVAYKLMVQFPPDLEMWSLSMDTDEVWAWAERSYRQALSDVFEMSTYDVLGISGVSLLAEDFAHDVQARSVPQIVTEWIYDHAWLLEEE